MGWCGVVRGCDVVLCCVVLCCDGRGCGLVWCGAIVYCEGLGLGFRERVGYNRFIQHPQEMNDCIDN